MTTVTDDNSGIRDGTLEIVIFSIFSVIGVAGLVLVPSTGRASIWKTRSVLRSGVRGTKILSTWLLLMANAVFLCFFAALLYSFEIQSRLTDISMYKSGLYSISLGFGAALALIGMLGGRYAW